MPTLLVFVPLLVAYGSALQWCIDRWNAPTSYFEHCWLVPLVGAFVVWQRRAVWRGSPAVPDLRGLWLLAPALLLHLVGALLMIDSLSAGSLVLAVPGAAWLALGRARLQGLWPVLWLVLFAVPVPIYVEGRLAFVLKEFAVAAGSALGNVFGADVVRQGSLLRVQGSDAALFVADACGGLRSLLAMLTIGYCIAFFLGPRRPVRRAALLVLAVPIAIGANVVRIAVLCLFARWFGVPFAEGTGHTLANVAEWIADVGALLLVDAWLSRGHAKRPEVAGLPPAPVAAPARRTGLRSVGIVLWLLAVPLLLLSLYRPFAGSRDRAARLPEVVAGFTLLPRSAAEEADFQRSLPRFCELLGSSDFVWRRYAAADGSSINLVALFHDTNWKSVHPPRICIEGSNMDIEQDDLVAVPALGPGATAGRIVAKSRDDGWRYVTLSLFGTRDWSSGSYAEYTWHHVPLALLRRNPSGFLLRVETPVRRDESLASAEQRCARFLQDLLPGARELLR